MSSGPSRQMKVGDFLLHRLTTSSHNGADLDDGPRGPQHHDDLRPPAGDAI